MNIAIMLIYSPGIYALDPNNINIVHTHMKFDYYALVHGNKSPIFCIEHTAQLLVPPLLHGFDNGNNIKI